MKDYHPCNTTPPLLAVARTLSLACLVDGEIHLGVVVGVSRVHLEVHLKKRRQKRVLSSLPPSQTLADGAFPPSGRYTAAANNWRPANPHLVVRNRPTASIGQVRAMDPGVVDVHLFFFQVL